MIGAGHAAVAPLAFGFIKGQIGRFSQVVWSEACLRCHRSHPRADRGRHIGASLLLRTQCRPPDPDGIAVPDESRLAGQEVAAPGFVMRCRRRSPSKKDQLNPSGEKNAR